MDRMSRECTTVMLCDEAGAPVIELVAYDVHRPARSNKSWEGRLGDEQISLPNLAAVERFARERGLTVDKLY